MQPSEQQKEVIDSPCEKIEVIAAAGSGKSTLIKMRVQARPQENHLYLTFSREARMDAIRRMPKGNVVVHSVNSLAFQMVKRIFSNEKLTGFFNVRAIRRFMPALNNKQAGELYGEMNRFLNSAEQEPPESCRELWMEMTNPRSSIPLGHSGYLKYFEINFHDFCSEPLFLNTHVCVLDEFQDSNPVTLSLFEKLPGKKLKVGDPYQSLYAFRGAVNSIQCSEGYERLPLSKSYRFNRVVADVANALLKFCEAPMLVTPVGLSDYPEERMKAGDSLSLPRNADRAFICRKNATALEKAIELSATFDSDGKPKVARPFVMVGGAKRYKIEDALELAKQIYNFEPCERNKDYRPYKSIHDIELYLEESGDDDQILHLFTKIPKMFRRDQENEIVPTLERIIQSEEANRALLNGGDLRVIQITNVHGCKGMEFDAVVLADDFFDFFECEEFQETGRIEWRDDKNQEELNLMYVAVTRAKHFLKTSKIIEKIEAHVCKVENAKRAAKEREERLARQQECLIPISLEDTGLSLN